MKYMTAVHYITLNLECKMRKHFSSGILSWAYLKYCQFILWTDCICQLWLLATNIWSGSEGHRRLIAVCAKSAGVSRKIWQTGPQNLETFAA